MSKFNSFSIIFSTGFCTGLIPFAPGTIGTVVGILIFFLTSSFPALFQIALFIFYLLVAYITIDKAIKFFQKNDPPQVNCDEISGIWFALLFFEPNFTNLIIAFALFRFFDILKPFPIKIFDKIHGPVGVIADDILAGLFTKGGLWLILKIF